MFFEIGNLISKWDNRCKPIRFDTWTAVLISFLFWTFLYNIARILQSEKLPEYSSRSVTVLHGTCAAYMGLYCCNGTSKWPVHNLHEPTTLCQSFLMVFSLGYFLADLLWCLYYQTETFIIIGHHVFSSFALFRILFKGWSGAETCCCIGAMEITNPLLQLRWFLRTHGYHNTPIFYVVEISFIGLFVWVRIISGSSYSYKLLANSKIDYEFKVLVVVMNLISWIFMVGILKFLYRKYFRCEGTISVEEQ